MNAVNGSASTPVRLSNEDVKRDAPYFEDARTQSICGIGAKGRHLASKSQALERLNPI